jgi:hypothetical protein
VSFSPQIQALLDAGSITEAQARDAEAKAPVPGELTGYARCMNVGCESYDQPRPIRLRRERTELRAADLANLLVTSSEYLIPLDDSELACGGCGQPCAIQETAPPTYAKMLVV